MASLIAGLDDLKTPERAIKLDLLNGGKAPSGWPLNRSPYYLETNIPGLFAAGDVRNGSVKRCASAVGEGAMAVTFAHRYLAEG